MELSRQEYPSGLSFPPPGDRPHPGTEPTSPRSLLLAAAFFPTEPPGKPIKHEDRLIGFSYGEADLPTHLQGPRTLQAVALPEDTVRPSAPQLLSAQLLVFFFSQMRQRAVSGF